MPTRTPRKTKAKSEEKILDQATDQLLRAIKSHAAANGRKLSRETLLNEGYSERFVEKVKKA